VYICRLLDSDWGFWKTVTLNLDRVAAYIHEDLNSASYSKALSSVEALRNRLDDSPKSLLWKLRGAIGERVTWYEVPEDRSQMR